jgi:hypothetical protein
MMVDRLLSLPASVMVAIVGDAAGRGQAGAAKHHYATGGEQPRYPRFRRGVAQRVTLISSTSKFSVALGGTAEPAPREP